MITTVYTSNYDSRFIIHTIQFTTMASAQIINCVACKEPVRPRQQGLQCNGCFRWNHRVCNTGISLEVYRAAVNEGAEIEWQCEFCQHPDADSTMEDVSLPDPPPAETSLEDLAAEPDLLPQQPPETAYHLVQEDTIRGKTKLVTNTGYTYNIRKRRPNGTLDWQCTVRRKDHRCKASVIQRDGEFFPGIHAHNHPGEFGILASTQIQARVKQVNNYYYRENHC